MIGSNETSKTQDTPVPPDRATWTRDGHRSATSYVAYWSEGKLLILCGHQHKTVAEAVACIQGADGSVKAFTDSKERPLTDEERLDIRSWFQKLVDRGLGKGRESS